MIQYEAFVFIACNLYFIESKNDKSNFFDLFNVLISLNLLFLFKLGKKIFKDRFFFFFKKINSSH